MAVRIICLLAVLAFGHLTIPIFALTISDIINISNTSGSSIAPQIAIGEEGNIYVIWQETDVDQDILFSASANIDNGFGDTINVTGDPGLESGARIAASDGKVFVVWFENDGEIYFSNSTIDDNGNANFSPPVNLSNNEGDSRNPRIAVSGQNVYIVWEDDVDGSSIPDIFFANSTDAGQTFSPPVNLSNNEGDSRNPHISVSESGSIFIAWQDDTPNPGSERDIFVRASINGAVFGNTAILNRPGGFSAGPITIPSATNDLYLVWETLDDASGNNDVFFADANFDGGADSLDFGEFVNVSNNTGFSTSPQFAVSGEGIVYVAWIDDIIGGNDVFIANSTNGGATFSEPVPISSSASISSGSFQIAILPDNQEDVYVAWRDANVGGAGDIFIAEITQSGQNLGEPINLSNNDGTSQKPVLAAFGKNLYVAWQDKPSDNNEVLFRALSTDLGEAASISIESISNDEPKWGRDIEVSGTTNGVDTDSVTIDWGDGSSTTGIPVGDSVWGPVSHSYNASEVGSISIVAELVDSGQLVKATSAPFEITILRHATGLDIDDFPNAVLQGSNLTLSGTLMDTDDDIGVVDATIIFTGTGAGGLGDVITNPDGAYTVEGQSPDSPGTLWGIQAAFAGNSAFEPSNSSTLTFDTAASDASQFIVPAGNPSTIDLVGFNASISFDIVESETTLFVMSCDSPASSRYIPLGICIVLSSTEDAAQNSYAHLNLSYGGRTLTDGHTENEIGIFHEVPGGYVEITESRNLDQNTVTGRTTQFSKFVVGIALHAPSGEDVMREQVYVGQNDLIFNEQVARVIEFDNSDYSVGSVVSVSVEDDNANNNSTIDSVAVNVTSTSDMGGIMITLVETGNNTGVFAGSFRLVTGPSSSGESQLHADDGDVIEGIYFAAAKAPLRIIFDEVVEAGILEVEEFVLDTSPGANIPGFEWISDAYEIRLIDGRTANNSQINIVMSYINVDIRNDDVILTDLFRVLRLDPASPTSGAFEWDDVTLLNPSDHTPMIDTTQKTVTGSTTFLSKFLIGHDVRDEGSGGGRGGGGIPRPGTGILLDASASVNIADEPERDGGAGGGGGSRSTAVAPTPSGSDVEKSITTSSGVVTVLFENVESDGQLKIDVNELNTFEEFFDEIAFQSETSHEHGIIKIVDRTYATAGSVFNIDATAVNFDGSVAVTIPYDEQLIIAFSIPESDVRFIHYDEDSGMWEDMTSNVDTQSNTVTGTLGSLSPVTAALILDPFVPSAPVIRASVSNFSLSDSGQLEMHTNLESLDSTGQSYVMIVQLTDEMGIVQHLDWEEGGLSAGEITDISRSWSDLDSGKYTIKIYLISDMQNPWLLSQAQAEHTIQ